MQPPFSCVPITFDAIERSLSPARLGRYLGAARGNKHHALRLYVWNSQICEALYFPSQIAEVSIRNAIHQALILQYGKNWFNQAAFTRTLPQRLQDQLAKVIREETAIYGANVAVDHIISGLMYGFWVHLLTSNYDNVLWPNHFGISFPSMPKNVSRQNLYDKAEKLRILRNRLAHHKPVFDRKPIREFSNLMILIEWICEETLWFASVTADVQATVSRRPQY